MKKTTSGLGLLTMTATAFLLAGCVSSPNAPAAGSSTGGNSGCPVAVDKSVTTTARLAYQMIAGPDLLVRDLGLLEKCMPNAKIQWSQFSSGGDVIQAFGSNSVDLGLLGSSPAARALSAPLNIPMQVVFIQDVIGKAETLVAKDSSIKNVADLVGKTVAVPFSSTSHYSLLKALDNAGVGASSVKLVNLAPDAMLAAWQSGQIDAAYVWDPVLSQLLASGTPVVSSADTAKMGAPTFDLSGATTSFIEANPKFMSMWTKLENEAVGMIANKPKAAADSIAAQLGIKASDVPALLKGYTFLPADQQLGSDYLGGKMATDLMSTAKFLASQGDIDSANALPAYKAGVYTAGLKAAGK
ncbi:MAG: taurine ABC transporter substrate-binding protein [Lacisediminihabitans sp.]